MGLLVKLSKEYFGAKLKNGQHHHKKLKFHVGLTCLVFSLEGTLNVVFFNQDSKKNDELDNVEKAHKNLEPFAHQVPEKFQNITPNMPTINTPLLYRKDNLAGNSSNACTDDIFFYEEILFLREELDHKQKTIDNLLKIINRMHENSNDSGGNIHKNTNTQPTQINATAEEQGRNNITVDDITYKDIPLNQTQSEEHQDEELQRHQVIENRSIITIENQLTEFRKKQQEKFTKVKKPHVSPKSNENLHR